jgi:carboxypeptidase T
MPRYRVAIHGQSPQAMLDLVHKHKVDVLDHGSRKLRDNLYRAYAILDPDQIKALEAAGYQVERHEDVDDNAKIRQREVATGDRYKQRR